MNKLLKLIPYWFLIFTIGFGWFILAPAIPLLDIYLHTSTGNILILISSYGYTMAILGLLAGYFSAKLSVKSMLYTGMVISFIGLLGRAFSPDYITFLFFGIIAAAAYPLVLAPIGSIMKSIDNERSETISGVSFGFLFFGLAMGSLIGPDISKFGVKTVLFMPVILAFIAMIFMLFVVKSYPTNYVKKIKGVFRFGMLKNWWVGLSIASVSVLFGSVASTVLHLHSLKNFIEFGGILGGLEFLGAAIGAIILPYIFEKINHVKLGNVFTGILSLLSLSALVYSLSFTRDETMMLLSFFFFGFFGNAYWTMALTSVTKYVSNPADAGFSTAMYSVFTNVGVSLIPIFVGVEFSSLKTIIIGVIIVLVIEIIAAMMSPLILSGHTKLNENLNMASGK